MVTAQNPRIIQGRGNPKPVSQAHLQDHVVQVPIRLGGHAVGLQNDGVHAANVTAGDRKLIHLGLGMKNNE